MNVKMSVLRKFIGWYGMDDRTKRIMEEHKRVVMVFPHTSYCDAFLYSLYFLEYETLRKRVRVLINPEAMGALGGILSKFGGVEATARLVKNGGCVKRVINEVSKMDEFIILLSPKGSIFNHPWRTGYYWFAKLLGCELVAGGFDYTTKQFVIKTPFSVENMSLDQAERRCKEDLYDITPLYPKYSEFATRCNENGKETESTHPRVNKTYVENTVCKGPLEPSAFNVPWMIGLLALAVAVFIMVVLICAVLGNASRSSRSITSSNLIIPLVYSYT